MSKPTATFVHMTDLHIAQPGVPDSFLNTDTSATLATVLAEVKAISPAPDFIIVSGDLTNRGTEPAFVELRRLLDEAALEIPMILALGNHDTRAPFYKVMLGRSEDTDRPYDHDQVIAGIHVIVVDTSLPLQGHGGLEAGQLGWLRDRLDHQPGVPKLVVMHHPMSLNENPDEDWQSMSAADTATLAEVFKGRTNVLGILTGHLHHDRIAMWHGIPMIMTGGQHDWINPVDLRDGVLHQLSGVSYAIGEVRPSGMTVSFVPRPEQRQFISRATIADLMARAHDFYDTESAA